MQFGLGLMKGSFKGTLLKLNTSIFLGSVIFALPVQAEILVDNPITFPKNKMTGPNAEGYYELGYIDIGGNYTNPHVKFEVPETVTVNQGSKVKSRRIHIGNHYQGYGKIVIDGKGSIWEVYERLNVGNAGANGELHITNGGVMLQHGANWSDPNYLAHGSQSLIYVDGEGSTLTMDNRIRAYDNSKIFIRNHGTINLNYNGGVSLPYVENVGYFNVKPRLTIGQFLQIGNEHEAGHFNFEQGVGFNDNATLMVKKLASNGLELPIGRCIGCKINYQAPEHLILKFIGSSASFSPNLTISQGNVEINEGNTFNKLKSLNNSPVLDLQEKATFTLNQLNLPESLSQTDLHFKHLTHAGMLDLADGTDQPKFIKLNVGNYVANGGTLLIDSLWKESADSLNSDLLSISESLTINKPVTIQTKNGIMGNVEERADKLVVQVDVEHAGEAFIGEARTQNAGVAYIIKKENSYYWSLGKAGEEFLIPSAAGYIQMPQSNLDLIYNNIGSLQARRGADFIYNPPANGVWGRILHKDTDENGQRFSQHQKQYIAQVGYDFLHVAHAHSHSHTGIYAAFARNDAKFFDAYRTINGVETDNKYAGSGKTQGNMLGLYHSLIHNSGGYVDLVANLSYLRNHYYADNERSQNNARGLALSAEIGHRFQAAQSHWSVVPQAQLIYQYLRLSDFHEQDKSIQQGSQQALLARLGARLTYQPETNWSVSVIANLYRDLKQAGSVNIGNRAYTDNYAKTWFDTGVLAQVKLNPQLSLYADMRIARSFGKPRSSYAGILGVEYRW